MANAPLSTGLVQPGFEKTTVITEKLGGSSGLAGSHFSGLSKNPLMTCSNCTKVYDSCTCETKTRAPIIEKMEDKTLVVKHVEPVEVKKVIERAQVVEHMAQPIIKEHTQAAIVKQEHQNVIHEHHKDIIVEHHKDIINEIHQPVIHQLHQPIIHEKHIHEIHQPIIHQKEQEIIHEKEQKLIHEQQQKLTHQEVRAPVTHEVFEKPVITTERKAPLVTGIEQRETLFVKETNLPSMSQNVVTNQNLGMHQHQHTATTGFAQNTGL